MKKIINGKAYNTETATVLASVRLKGNRLNVDGSRSDKLEDVGTSTLYQTTGGAYFFVREHEQGALVHGIDFVGGKHATPYTDQPGLYEMTRKEAIQWAVHHGLDADKIDVMFGGIPEAGTKSGTMLLRVPESLKKRMEQEAKDAGQSVNAWAMRCMEDCCSRYDLVRALASAHHDLFTLTFDAERFNLAGYQAIAASAQDHVEEALRALRIDDYSKEPGGEVLAGPDVTNWLAREYDHLRTEDWQSEPRS